MPTQTLTITDLPCPSRPGRNHTLVVRQSKRQVCAFCESTDRQIINSTPLLHRARPCACYSCMAQPIAGGRCAHCHLAISVHAP